MGAAICEHQARDCVDLGRLADESGEPEGATL